jgi:hypothetical protein
MPTIGVLLFYIPTGEGKPLILGHSNDQDIFASAAAAAIREAEISTQLISDPVLAAAQAEELQRLRKLLSLLALPRRSSPVM